MRIFTLNNDYTVVCNWAKTRQGFKHTATLCQHGQEVASTKICYLNRTWERYEYESVLLKIVEDNFKDKEKEDFKNIVRNFR